MPSKTELSTRILAQNVSQKPLQEDQTQDLEYKKLIPIPPKIIFSILNPTPNITKISTNVRPQKQYGKTKLGAFSHIVSGDQNQEIAPITNELPQQPPETI